MTTSLSRLALATVIACCLLSTPALRAEIAYPIEQCCSLCPEAANPDAYDTDTLKVNKLLLAGADNWLFRSSLDLHETFQLKPTAITALRRFRTELAKQGTELLLVYHPTRGLMNHRGVDDHRPEPYNYPLAAENYRLALQKIRSTGIITPDLSRLLTDAGSTDFHFRRDAHWTPAGARKAAKLVADRIKQLDLYPTIPTVDFVTERVGLRGTSGGHQNAAYLLCGIRYSNQYVDEFETHQLTQSSDSLDLFTDQPQPQVVVVGTSFSDSKLRYNFVGFLQQFLAVDILNVAVAGGGIAGSLTQYFASEDFQTSPPKLIIWEVPGYTPLYNSKVYRQLVPRITNGCANQTPELTSTIKLARGDNEALFNGDGMVKNITSGNYLVDIQFSDPAIKRLDATVWYHNLRKERLVLKHRDRVDGQGRFVFELKADTHWKDLIFTSLEVTIDDTYPKDLTLTASLCKRDDIP